MRLIDRRDTPLVAALLIGTLAMFAQPLRAVLSLAEDVSRTHHVDLIPGLFIFVTVFTASHWQRHRDARAALQLAAREAEEAKRSAERMAQLVETSNALVNAVDFSSFRREANLHAPKFFGQRPIFIGTVESGTWRWVVEPCDGSGDALAEVAPGLVRSVEAGEHHYKDWRLFVLRGAGRSLGLLGVSSVEPLTSIEVGQVEAVLAVIGVTIKNVQLFEQMQVLSVSDSLTGCFNRAHAVTVLGAELRRQSRTHSSLAIALLDVDEFKTVNDQYGHVVGDRLLAAIGDTLRRSLRSSDVKCRYGGDEFLIVLPETPLEAAEHVATQMRRAIQKIDLSGLGLAPLLMCGVSVGVAAAEPGEFDPLAVIQRADLAMYRDKARRRLAAPELRAEPDGGSANALTVVAMT